MGLLCPSRGPQEFSPILFNRPSELSKMESTTNGFRQFRWSIEQNGTQFLWTFRQTQAPHWVVD